MPYFPGIAMIIDDQFNLIYQSEVTGEESIQQQALIELRDFLDSNCIPFVPLTNTADTEFLIAKIKNYDNVRLLVLDLDLNNDGEVGSEDDIPLIILILRTALIKYGYFFLLINSAHSEAWEQIKPLLTEELAVLNKKNSSITLYDKKAGDITTVLLNLQDSNYSLELIYDFETALNKARDKAFYGLVDNEKRTWNKIYKQLLAEASSQSSFLLSSAYLSVLRQHLLSTTYTAPTVDDPIDDALAIKAFGQINYIPNINNKLNEHPVWTGNLYYLEKPIVNHHHYALMITPECDLAQSKCINFQVVFGYEINEATFPEEYDHSKYDEAAPPTHAYKVGRKKNKWRDKINLKDTGGFIEHLYPMPFASKDDKTIVLDFRDLTFVSPDELAKWKLIKRVNEPMITDILDKLSLIFNRKGLLPLLPKGIKII